MLAVTIIQMELFQNWEYLVLNIAGMLLLIGFAAYAAQHNRLNRYNTLLYIAGIPLVFLFGARLFYMLFYTNLSNPPVHLYDLKLYGFSLYGGLLTVALYATAAAWFNRIPVWIWLDYHTPGLIGCAALGKTGCFFNGCCFGTPTIMPWGIPYGPGSQAYNYYIVQALNHLPEQVWQVYSDRIHPVQIYESGIALILLFIALYLLRQKTLPGLVFLLAAAIYSLARLGLFYLRAHPETGTFFHVLPWLYLIIVCLSLGGLFIKIFKIRESAFMEESEV